MNTIPSFISVTEKDAVNYLAVQIVLNKLNKITETEINQFIDKSEFVGMSPELERSVVLVLYNYAKLLEVMKELPTGSIQGSLSAFGFSYDLQK